MSCLSEVWKDIPGYEGLYQASNLGNVKSIIRSKELVLKQCIKNNKRGSGKHDYVVVLEKDAKKKQMLVSRIIAMTFIRLPMNDETVNHIDGNPENNNSSNLEWLSRKENIIDGFNKGHYFKNCKECLVYDKKTKHILAFRSMRQASLEIGKSPSYIGILLRLGIKENKDYSWRLL